MNADITGDVLVIGAGPAGLAAAWHLEQAGIPYTIVERTDHIGSTWAALYPSLRLNTASFVSHLPGQRIPLRYGLYMMGDEFYAYLRDYAARHPFNIRFGVEVTRLTPADDGWCAHLRSVGQPDELTSGHFRFVIVASGRFGKPYLPPLPGMTDFTGAILHAGAYRQASAFRGQRVVVAGSGPSGTDIALELQHTAALPVLLSIRTDIVIARRYPYGLPDTLWQVIVRSVVPVRWRKAVLNRIVYQGYPDTDGLGMTLAPNRTDRRGSSAPIRGRGLIDAVRAGCIVPVAGIASFHPAPAEASGGVVELMDGSRHTVDAAILSTGYRPAIDYLDFPYETDTDGWPVRVSRNVEGGSPAVAGYAGLYLVGRFYRGLGPLNNIRHEARWAVEAIAHQRDQRAAGIRPAARTVR